MNPEWSDADLQQNVSEGRWVADGVKSSRVGTLGSLVSAGYDAYARILYPVRVSNAKGDGVFVRWSDIARHTGATAHAEMELHALDTTIHPGSTRYVSGNAPAPAAPVPGWPEQLATIVDVLAGHTTTPDDCWFAIWEGNTALDDIRESTPTARIGDNYFLLRGPGARATADYRGLAPNMWWPADRSWCMVAHFDFPCVYFGGNQRAADALLAMPEIEAWPARADQIITADNDQLNK